MVKIQPPPDPDKKVTTGTTGIIVDTYDGIMWTSRIVKEDRVHRKPTTTFMTRPVLKGPMKIPNPPQRHVPAEAAKVGHVDASTFGYDPASEVGKDFQRAVDWRC